MRVRRFTLADTEATHAIFVASVREGASRFYSPDQRIAWAPNDTPPPEWRDRLADAVSYVAEDKGVATGFAAMTHDGHLDFLYVAPALMGSGVADALYTRLMADPALAKLAEFTVQASHFSRRFLLRHGWQDARPEPLDRFGQTLTVFRMRLTRP